jgi:hypothetical protein
MHVKYFWREGYERINCGTRVLELAADSREAALGKGARLTSTNTHEAEHTTQQWGWSSTIVARRITVVSGAARSGGADIRSAAAGKTMYGGFWLKLPYPTSLRSEPRTDFSTQPLPSSLPTIEKSASCGVLGISRKHTVHIGGPLAASTTWGGYGRYCTDQPVP